MTDLFDNELEAPQPKPKKVSKKEQRMKAPEPKVVSVPTVSVNTDRDNIEEAANIFRQFGLIK